MDSAFVLINCDPGQEQSILEQLRQINNVVDAQGTYGVYDIVARIESDSRLQLDDIISEQIRKLDHVNSTLTLIPIDEQNIISDVIPEQKKPLDEF